MDDARYYSIPDAARRCGVDAAAISSLVKSQRITAFIALPVLLAHPPKELRRPGNPPTFTYVSGMYALDATAGAALAAGHPTPIDKVWRYGEYTEGDYRNHGPVLLKDPYTPAPADLHVNIDEVQALLHPLKATPGRETAADMPATEAGRRLQENAVAAKNRLYQEIEAACWELLECDDSIRFHSDAVNIVLARPQYKEAKRLSRSRIKKAVADKARKNGKAHKVKGDPS